MTECKMVESRIYFWLVRAYIYVENQTVIHVKDEEL